jgi:hypothetical protein
MIATHFSDSIAITGVVALFFVVLALIAFARAILRKEPSNTKRFRVGVFIERDTKELVEEQPSFSEANTEIIERGTK